MKGIAVDESVIAFCGLYCGACGKYLKGKCPGCMKNEKATWCGVRSCCLENEYRSCADCKTFDDPDDCKKFDNFFARVFGFIFRSDRRACICMISDKGYTQFAEYMAKEGLQTIKKSK